MYGGNTSRTVVILFGPSRISASAWSAYIADLVDDLVNMMLTFMRTPTIHSSIRLRADITNFTIASERVRLLGVTISSES